MQMQGTLEISVHYHQFQVEVIDEEIDQECIHLSLRILRAAGLKASPNHAVCTSPLITTFRMQSEQQ